MSEDHPISKTRFIRYISAGLLVYGLLLSYAIYADAQEFTIDEKTGTKQFTSEPEKIIEPTNQAIYDLVVGLYGRINLLEQKCGR